MKANTTPIGVLADARKPGGDVPQAREICCPFLLKIVDQWPLVPARGCRALCNLVCVFANAKK